MASGKKNKLMAEIQRQTVLVHELQSLSREKRVFQQVTNVPVYFLESRDKLLQQAVAHHQKLLEESQQAK